MSSSFHFVPFYCRRCDTLDERLELQSQALWDNLSLFFLVVNVSQDIDVLTTQKHSKTLNNKIIYNILLLYGNLCKGLRSFVLVPYNPFRVVLGWAYRGLTGGFLLLQNFSVAISVSPHVCFILVLILTSVFLR